MSLSPNLIRQKELYDEAMVLVSAGIAMQTEGNLSGAEQRLSQAVKIMEEALQIEYSTAEEQIASRLNKKMTRYVKTIISHKNTNSSGQGKRLTMKINYIDIEQPIQWYRPITQLFQNSEYYKDIFPRLASLFGFQQSNLLNQEEHLVLLLTNAQQQLDLSSITNEAESFNSNLKLLRIAITNFHVKLFNNYKKWCRYLSQKPQFSQDPLMDIALFFLIWGEAGNFRHTPELLCFLYHKMSPRAFQDNRTQQDLAVPSDYFLSHVIRPIFNELQKDNDKKTSKGYRAPHTQIRNYDDFNEFFWRKKCLKYDVHTISQAFSEVDKKGNPKIAKKTFNERRSWIRAALSFRRILCFNIALFIATACFAVNMILFCPDPPSFYSSYTNRTVLGKQFFMPEIQILNTEVVDDKCVSSKLMSCLSIDSKNQQAFDSLPIDFSKLLEIVPFENCLRSTSSRCSCYSDLITDCFSGKGETERVSDENPLSVNEYFVYDQSKCYPTWKNHVKDTIELNGVGRLNCKVCDISLSSIIKNPSGVVDFALGLINFKRKDKGVWVMLGGFGFFCLVLIGELLNRLFSSIGIGLIGKSLPVPMSAYCQYTFFWISLFACKVLFDYKFMIKTLVESTLFMFSIDNRDYMIYSSLMIPPTISTILFLFAMWAPAIIVFLYDAQIFYSVFSVVFGSIRGFNLHIGDVRSFRILRSTFKFIPEAFNKKIVPNMSDLKQKKKRKTKNAQDKLEQDADLPLRRFERVSYSQGAPPITIKAKQYTYLLENRDDDEQAFSEIKTPNRSLDYSLRPSNVGSITGIFGTAFELVIPFAMAWNRCLQSLRFADIISDRELNVLSYLIDSTESEERRLYAPAFLTAGKLDESLDILVECNALYEKLKSDKKKKVKTLQKIESAMRDRLLKDDLRVESILGAYKFSSQVLRILLGEEHKEIDEVFTFIEEMVYNHTVLKGLNLSNLHGLRSAAADLMQAILEVPSDTSSSSIKFQRSLYQVIDAVEVIMSRLKDVVKKQEQLVQILNESPLKPSSFFFPGDAQHYASSQLRNICKDKTAIDIVSRAYQLLTVDNFDAEPKSEEGRRRLRFFVNSLFMDMPEASSVRKMHSFSICTPYYNEIVMYSIKDLTTENDDCIRLLFYLKTIYPVEWENLLERLKVKDEAEALKKNPIEVRLWASYRGQTLARTVRGMMYNEEAIRFLYWLEIGENEPMHLRQCNCNRCKKLDEMVALKFSYTCTCQIYGKQKDEQVQQALDIEFLLHKHRNLRVAYVDGPKKVKDGAPKYFSVLIRSLGDKIVEVYRIELPGNPIIGEGKPENQNHAIIFTRGEYLQCIDMNQDGYLEECLKMPNLIALANNRPLNRPLTIIGFREHIFTGGVSNLASFMSIQELSFVSLGQRMLAQFHCRQHYGHPDLFDKIFAMTTGGTAKPSKVINLSEDIFAGFNSTLRGGQSSHSEFIQAGKGRDVGMQQLALFEAKLSSGAGESVMSRDVMRMATRLDFFRLQCWFYGNLGWYITQTLTVVAIYLFIYGKLYQAISGLDRYFLERGGLSIGETLNTSWSFQMGMLLVVPVIAVVGVEQGFRHGITYLFWNILTLGPVFFTFQMGTKMHYFDRTLIHGGAKYRATGRGFTIKHEKFAELFRFYAFSHFYRAVELAFLLILFGCYGTFSWCNCPWTFDLKYYNNYKPLPDEWNRRCYAVHYQACVMPTNQNYGMITFALWIVAATWMWGPFFFNPSGLDWDKIIDDYSDWQNWLRTMNDSSESWCGWWTSELDYLENSSSSAKFIMFLRKSRFILIAIGIYLRMVHKHFYHERKPLFGDVKYLTLIILAAFLVALFLLLLLGYIASRITKKMERKQRRFRKIKFYCGIFFCLLLMASLLIKLTVSELAEIFVIINLVVYWFMQLSIIRLRYSHVAVRAIARGYDRLIGWIIFGPIMFFSMFLPFLAHFQQRVMFNNAFTSGLEVSKLFANDAARKPIVKIKKTKKR